MHFISFICSAHQPVIIDTIINAVAALLGF